MPRKVDTRTRHKVVKTKSGSTRTYTKSQSGKWSITGWNGKSPRRKK
jgi:predicted secreted protein